MATENLTPLSNEEWIELCYLGSLTCFGVGLSLTQQSRADALGKRIRIQRPPPPQTPPGQMPPWINIPVMTPAQTIAGDPGVQGPIA